LYEGCTSIIDDVKGDQVVLADAEMSVAQFDITDDQSIEIYSNLDRLYDIEVYAAADSQHIYKVLDKDEAYSYRNYHPGDFFLLKVANL
jgi:hypothetical protein